MDFPTEREMSVRERIEILSESSPDTWIALSQDESRVIARGDNYIQAVDNAEAAGEKDPVLLLVPTTWTPMVL